MYTAGGRPALSAQHENTDRPTVHDLQDDIVRNSSRARTQRPFPHHERRAIRVHTLPGAIGELDALPQGLDRKVAPRFVMIDLHVRSHSAPPPWLVDNSTLRRPLRARAGLFSFIVNGQEIG
jgi:hypothetical protein